MRAMILAAGRGERMRPLTDTIPKPLLWAGGQTLIERIIEQLRHSGFEDLVINLGWRGEEIRNSLGDGSRLGVRIHYSQEPPGALETAGGVVHALPLLGTKPFLVVGGDVHCDYPFERLRGFEPAGQGHLVMVDNPEHHPEGDFALRDDHIHFGPPPCLTYSGIGVFRPQMFGALAPGRRPLRPILEDHIAHGSISGEHYRGEWADIGTPERLEALDRRLRSRHKNDLNRK